MGYTILGIKTQLLHNSTGKLRVLKIAVPGLLGLFR